MTNENVAVDVSTLSKGDVVYYFHHKNGKFYIENGVLKEDCIYKDGVELHGEGWKQYVSKWFVCKVERNGEVLFEQ